MAVYDVQGKTLNSGYDVNSTSLQGCYSLDGTYVPLSGGGGGGGDDYTDYDTPYQKAILDARDEWKTQYRADNTVIPIILHTDQHGVLSSDSLVALRPFTYMNLAIKWNEVSACLGLGDVDMNNYQLMWNVLRYVPTKKQINLWGNHDLWRNYQTVDNQFVIDWDTNYFDNSAYGDLSYAYSKKGIEYHIDNAHRVKYVVISGWEIDKAKGGYSYYNISSQTMEDVIDMLERTDGYDIVILTHCAPFSHSSVYNYIETGDTLYNTPVKASSDGTLTDTVITNVTLDSMLSARNAKTNGTITDSYGNVHSYDFRNCTGKILCCLCGHGHSDKFGYSVDGGILSIMYDAFAYGTSPFYMINIDRTKETVDGWKIGSDAVFQAYSIPFSESDL